MQRDMTRCPKFWEVIWVLLYRNPVKCWDPYGKQEKGMENTLVRRNFHQLSCVCIRFRCPRVLSSPFEQKTKVEH